MIKFIPPYVDFYTHNYSRPTKVHIHTCVRNMGVLPPLECGTLANGPELVIGGVGLPSSSTFSLLSVAGALILTFSSVLLWWSSSRNTSTNRRSNNLSWFGTKRSSNNNNNNNNNSSNRGWSRRSKKKKKNTLDRPKKRELGYDADVSASQRRAMLNDTDDDDNDNDDELLNNDHDDHHDDYYRSDNDDDENDNDHAVVTTTAIAPDHDFVSSKHHHQANRSSSSTATGDGASRSTDPIADSSTTNADTDWEEVVRRVGGKKSKLRRRLKSGGHQPNTPSS